MGDSADLTSTYVGWCAQQRGWTVLALAEDTLGTEWTFARQQDGDGMIDVDGRLISLDMISGAYVRFNPEPAPVARQANLEQPEAALLIAERREGLHALLEAMPCPVANRPYSGRANASKPYQMRWLQQVGFTVPEWLVTNEPEAAASFAAGRPRGAIYKSISGLRSRVRRFEVETLATLAGNCPIIIQDYIAGHDVRIHVVGSAVFGTRVRASGIDYRWESQDACYEPVPIPAELARLCIDATRRDHLLISGLDFRVDEAGNWFCLEMNPVPTFLPYEMSTQQPICAALLDLFADRTAINPAPPSATPPPCPSAPT